MTQNLFVCECLKRLIDPELALYDTGVAAALEARDDAAILEALDNNF